MWMLKPVTQPARSLNESFFTVGAGQGFDCCLPGEGGCDQILYTLHSEGHRLTLIPGSEKVLVNGKAVTRPSLLRGCDRIECRGHVAVVLDDTLPRSTASGPSLGEMALEILQEMASGRDETSWSAGVEKALERLIGAAGAEEGYLVTETGLDQGWELVAEAGGDGRVSRAERRRQIVSSTVLAEAIRKGKPVYVESLIGHPWEAQASLMAAKVFSLACLPFVISGRAFGCACLYTRTPGKTIDEQKLTDLQLLATQVALLVATRAETHELRREASELRRRGGAVRAFRFAEGSPMEAVQSRIARLAPTDLSVLVSGETGAGKELVARELHRLSARSRGPFVAVNCGAIPPTLIESTLFGYVKGAFTGATKDHPGKFVQASGGTIFLDEIGDLPLDMQVRLLRVLQEKVVEPVGSTFSTKVDFRVIAATHRDLKELVSEGKFREDLYYRLNGAGVELPPLRDRRADIALLAAHFLEEARPGSRLSESAMATLVSHSWPGNVRELEQVVRRAAALAENDEIASADLEMEGARPAGQPSPQTGLREAQEAFTRDWVKRALEASGGNRAKAARELGISERTLYRILSGDTSGT